MFVVRFRCAFNCIKLLMTSTFDLRICIWSYIYGGYFFNVKYSQLNVVTST